jgi:hypothetical protein
LSKVRLRKEKKKGRTWSIASLREGQLAAPLIRSGQKKSNRELNLRDWNYMLRFWKDKEELKGGAVWNQIVCSTYQLGGCWHRWRHEEAGVKSNRVLNLPAWSLLAEVAPRGGRRVWCGRWHGLVFNLEAMVADEFNRAVRTRWMLRVTRWLYVHLWGETPS